MSKKFKVGDRVKLVNYRSWGDCEITQVHKENPRRYSVKRIDVDCMTCLCRIRAIELLEVKRGRNRRS
jgi:hypothetical protein